MTEAQAPNGDRGAAATDRHGWSLPEVMTLTVSLVVVAAFAAVALVGQVRQSGPALPVLEVNATGEATAVGEWFHLPVTVVNTGNTGAKHITVTAELARPDAAPEVASLVIEVLPAGASDEGIVVFGSDPNDASVRAWVSSFLLP